MMIDANARYLKSHEWARKENGNVFAVGITAYAAEQLGDIVYMELPQIGREVKEGEAFGIVESVKSASDMYAPISGTVTEINKTVPDNPDILKTDAYQKGWLIKLEAANPAEFDGLMDEKAYRTYLETEA
ncbi:MAG: glycine cleavage system protein GcvH [Planctomycetaceae bacterium]|nr:glycine cleavage system protein GcvH [Planctomycetaceae bacterium]